MNHAPVPRSVRLLTLLGVPLLALLISPTPLTSNDTALAAQDDGSAIAFVLDADPHGSTPNTPTSLGKIDSCARINVNGIQDADEDAADAVDIDLGVVEIPSPNPAVAINAVLGFPGSGLTVTSFDHELLLNAASGSNLLWAGDPVPDSDGQWSMIVADIGPVESAESGSGAVVRFRLSADQDTPLGLHDLTLAQSAHIDPVGNAWPPHVVSSASIAIDAPCTRDADGDGVYDLDESFCGADPLDSASRPERIDGAFAAADDDGDGLVDEPLPAVASEYDCDGDGYLGSEEAGVYAPSTQGDQDPCGTNPSETGWPADLVGGGVPDSTNRITLTDVTSFLGPIRYMGTDVGTHPSDHRWDLKPGKAPVYATDINVNDLTGLVARSPAMLDGARPLNGPPCPWP